MVLDPGNFSTLEGSSQRAQLYHLVFDVLKTIVPYSCTMFYLG
jgi:hypothetical protein